MPTSKDNRGEPDNLPSFQTTHWSVVITAGEREKPEFREAFANLCHSYWYPCYAYLRRSGKNVDQAQELTQEFFLKLVESKIVEKADQRRGRFRDFLLVTLRNFVANQRRKALAQRRGGGIVMIALDFDSAESQYQMQIADHRTPENIYLRQWAIAFLESTLQRLQNEVALEKSGPWFENIKIGLTSKMTQGDYSRLASELNSTAAAVKQAIYRLRQRYRQMLRDEIRRTSPPDADIDHELEQLRHFLLD